MSEPAVSLRSDRAVFGVVFLMFFAFSYSEPLISGVYPIVGNGDTGWRIAVIAVDALVLGVVGVMKREITRTDGDTPRLWRWWSTGVAILLSIDVLRLVSHQSVQIDLLIATIYAAAMGFTTAASLNADPFTLLSTARQVALPTDWARARAIVPLVLGTWACYLAASAFIDVFDVDTVRTLDAKTAAEIATMPAADEIALLSQLCEGAISPTFFHQVVGVLPVLVLALGVEFNYFRRTLTDAGQRAATAATVTVMAAGLALALSTLPWDGKGCGDVLSAWHEYVAFLLAVQGVFTGLVTLVWLLVTSTPDIASNADSMSSESEQQN
ncbi:hypothetical protein [Mycobacterium sp. 155]|uniref:hypothetical protein n=1 Tax=Mycobacterium sp. 155 TaxID=1157943 RepID=UPI00037D3AD2|nr:hypothetical protein [Mycobacterium sp. 155]